jgi:hypothetical protein
VHSGQKASLEDRLGASPPGQSLIDQLLGALNVASDHGIGKISVKVRHHCASIRNFLFGFENSSIVYASLLFDNNAISMLLACHLSGSNIT